MFCSKCGNEINGEASFCNSCGLNVSSPPVGVPVSNVNTATTSQVQRDKWSAYTLLVIISILIPFIGVILGISGLVKNKEGSAALLAIGVVFWLIWIVFLV